MNTPKTLTSDQVTMLLDNLTISHGTSKQKLRGIRNHSMAIFMLETGLRVGELCGLRIDDLWFSGEPVLNLVVRKEIAKNKQERFVPVSDNLYETIKVMADSFWLPLVVSPCSYAFFANVDCGPLSTRSVERIILEAGLTAFNIEVTPHMLRHTFASRMMRKTNARVVQALLGHSSLQSTQIYMHPNSEDLRKAINS